MGEYFTKSIIGIIILIIIGYGMLKGGKVYEWFIEGAKDGLKVCVNIFPYLLAMIVAVEMFKSANLLDMLNNILSPAAAIIGIPRELIPLILIKPLSGSGAIAIFTNIVQTYGPDTAIGLVASVIMGTTETIFYTVTVYFGAVKVKKVRHTVWAAIIADLTAIIMAVNLVKLLFC